MAKVTVIGGGTGLSVLLRGIKTQFDQISAVVSVTDDGGNSGKLREDLGMLPPGDIRSCLVALADEEMGMEDLFNYRFKDGRIKGQNIGNLLLAAFNEIYGDFEEAISSISNILKVKGKVIPVATEDMVLCAELENGNIVMGESNIPIVSDRENSPIRSIFLHGKKFNASKRALEAIREADILLFGPGSLYTSVIVNFLMEGMADAITESHAKKIYIANVMTQPGETTDFSLIKHVDKITDILGNGNVDYVIANNRKLDEGVLIRYIDEKSNQVLPLESDRAKLHRLGIELIENDFINVRHGYIRHDAAKISSTLKTMLEG